MKNDLSSLVPNRNIRNQIRGLLDKKIQDDRPSVYPAIISKLYSEKDEISVRWVEHQIRNNPNYSHVNLPKDFPESLNPFQGKVLLPMKNVGARFSSILDRATINRETLLLAATQIKNVNDAIFRCEIDKAVELLDEHFEKYGFSHILLRKVIFLANTGIERSLSLPLQSLLEKLKARDRDTIRPSLTDAFNRKRQYLSVALNVMNISAGTNLSRFKKAISQYSVRPICYNSKDFEAGFEAFSNYSLLDTMYFASSQLEFSEDIDFLNEYRKEWMQLDVQFRSAFRYDDFDASKLGVHYEKQDRRSDDVVDMAFYRHLSAFVECPEAMRLRALGDFYLAYRPESQIEPDFVATLRTKRFGEVISWGDLVAVRASSELPADIFSPTNAGTLERTIAMAIFFARESMPSSMTAKQLFELMNNTTFADKVLSERALKGLRDYASLKQDLLFKVIPLCLLSVDPKNSRDEFHLRRTLQDIVNRDFDGDYVSFTKSMLDQAYQVGSYLYGISTDEFLIQCYHLFQNSSEAVECRAQLHELIYEVTDDRRFQDLASSLRLSAKIAKARGDLDDSRIYVDLNRFDTWLKDNKLDRILTLIRSGACQPDVLEQISIVDVNSSQGNESELLKILGECYKEFCENRIFGIASYLGRRIRHGTLRGTLLQDLSRSIEERFEIFESDENCKQYFLTWKAEFEIYIKKIGSDFFHIRSAQKPKGMINPDITDGQKFQYLKKGGTSVLSAFDDYEDPDYFVRIISEMCWQIASTDLANSQSVLSVCKANFKVSGVPENVSLALGAMQNDYIRHVNSRLDEKFNVVANWFSRPKITVPSVDLPTLLQVVHSEVSEEFNSYNEATTDDEQTKIVLTGSSYHIVYDYLYVALKNAAEHGKPGGNVTIQVDATYDNSLITQLKISIESEYKIGESYLGAMQGIAACQLDNLDKAYVEEGKSGLRKIMRLERDWIEVKKIYVEPKERTFLVEMVLDLSR